MTNTTTSLRPIPLPQGAKLSFELFPPKQTHNLEGLGQTVDRLLALNPGSFSVTCGAGGDGATGTDDVVSWLRGRQSAPVAPHVTCTGRSRSAIQAQAEEYAQQGITNVVALRGDGATHQDGPAYASELVSLLSDTAPFSIAVAAYPETHPEAQSAMADLDCLKRKQDAGASLAITQYCFDTETILRFRDAMHLRGITIDLTIGIMPIHHFPSIQRFSKRCGASIPDWLVESLHGLEDDTQLSDAIAAHLAVDQMRWLMQEGLSRFHIYTLNKAPLSLAIARMLHMPDRMHHAA